MLRQSYLFFTASLFFVSFANVNAATIFVDVQVGYDGCDLVQAVIAANNDAQSGLCFREGDVDDEDDVIQISEELSEIRLTSAFDQVKFDDVFQPSALPAITSTIRIVGNAPGLTTIVRDNDSLFRFFLVYGGSLTLENIELFNGNVYPDGDGGAIHVTPDASLPEWKFSTLVLTNVQLRSNQAKEGGGLYIYSGANVLIRQASFISNYAIETPTGGDGIGGGIRAEPNVDETPIRLRIFDSTFSDNRTDKSGGGLNFHAIRGSTLGVFNSTFVNNNAKFNGGGMFLLIDDNENLVKQDLENVIRIHNSIVAGNNADAQGRQFFLIKEELENDIEIRDNVIGTLDDENLVQATNIDHLPDNILTMPGEGLPLALSQIIEPISQSSSGMYFYRLAEDSPAIDSAKNYYFRLVYDPIIDGDGLQFSPGCAGLADLRRAIPEYRSDQLGGLRPSGEQCDIGSHELRLGADDQCYVVPILDEKIVVFCL